MNCIHLTSPRFHTLFAVTVAALTLGASVASAQIELYALRKSHHYTQSADATVDASYFRFDAQLRTTNVGDLGSVMLDGATSGPIALNENGQYWTHYSPGYLTEAELDAAFPDHTYTIDVAGGLLNSPQTFMVDMPSLYPSAIPTLTGSTFSGLQAWDPASGDFLMTFNSHLDVPDISYVLTYVTFYDKTLNNGVPIFWSLASTSTSLWLDAALFQSGHEYEGSLQFFHQYSHERAPHFGTLKVLTTSFKFTTSTSGGGGGGTPVPDSAATGAMALALLGLAACGRRIRSTGTPVGGDVAC
jgi:hypothetical protein